MTTLEHPIRADTATPFTVPVNRWDAAHAATLSPEALLLYRSNLLGSDLTVTNFGGGNTSAKLAGVDPLTGETHLRHHMTPDGFFKGRQIISSNDED